MIINGNRYLCTLDEPMVMKSGLLYQIIWGTVYVHKFEDVFNFASRGHANYFYVIGDHEDGENPIIAGCRLNLAIPCATKPNNPLTNHVSGWDATKEKTIDVWYESIFIADEK